jgi:hypothetical protein
MDGHYLTSLVRLHITKNEEITMTTGEVKKLSDEYGESRRPILGGYVVLAFGCS